MKVTGIGGVMFRAKDPEALSAWYKKHLGIDRIKWEQEAGPTAFAPFAADSEDLVGKSQGFILNFRVDDLNGMIKKLKADGVTVAKDIETYEGLGRFIWIEDLEGNRVELWEPEPES
ncbi:MAG TPA: VOC family protein [Candidatus Saccharimonadales bacterium]|nr:VOC family protein [Candidatus Saccharimonadales bacterium]